MVSEMTTRALGDGGLARPTDCNMDLSAGAEAEVYAPPSTTVVLLDLGLGHILPSTTAVLLDLGLGSAPPSTTDVLVDFRRQARALGVSGLLSH